MSRFTETAVGSPGYVTYAPFSAKQYERVKPNENAVKKERAE